MAGIDYLQKFPLSILNRSITSVLGKLWSIYSIQLDEITAQIESMYLLNVITTQTGHNLDRIGTIVKETREPAQTDADYRIDLLAATKSRISNGSIPDLLEVAGIVAENATDKTSIQEMYPARIIMHTNIERLIQNDAKILDESTAAGVALNVTYTSGTAVPFSFDNASREGLGWSDTSLITDVMSGSGQFAGIII